MGRPVKVTDPYLALLLLSTVNQCLGRNQGSYGLGDTYLWLKTQGEIREAQLTPPLWI